jgi:transposase
MYRAPIKTYGLEAQKERPTMEHIAIDLHDEYSQICVMTLQREKTLEARLPTTRNAFRSFFEKRTPGVVIMEAGPHATWVGELVKELGHTSLVCHARRVRLIAESRNKNDRVDAELLARLSVSDMDLLRPIQQRSTDTLADRSLIRSRAALVETQKRLRTTLRGLVKPFGVRLRGGVKSALADLAGATLPPQVRTSTDCLLETLETIAEQLRELDLQIDQLNEKYEVTENFRSIPGVGPLVAITYTLAIVDPSRFKRGDTGPFLGLTPPNRSSAGKKLAPSDRGRPGDRYLRGLLIQSAWTLMNSRSESDLAMAGRRLKERIGGKKAAVAVARKIAELMHHLWVSNEQFVPHPRQKK